MKGDKSRKLKLHLFNDGTQDQFYVELTFNRTGSDYILTEVGSYYTLNSKWFDKPKYSKSLKVCSPFDLQWLTNFAMRIELVHGFSLE